MSETPKPKFPLRMVPLFVTSHTFFAHLGSGLRYSRFLRNLPTNTKVFLCGL